MLSLHGRVLDLKCLVFALFADKLDLLYKTSASTARFQISVGSLVLSAICASEA